MNWGDLVYFAVVFLPGMAAGAAGMIRGGYGWALAAWIGYMLFFFNIWETYVLCRHCPFYGENSRILHCIANHGMIKIWKYQPGPMTHGEQIQFLLGAGMLVIFPLPFLILGGEMLLLVLTVLGMGNFLFSLVKQICYRCLNFSCPLNRVPAGIREQYLARNPVLAEVWQTGDRESTAN
jgi:hypothetical protein